MSLAYDVGHAVCRVVPFGICIDNQGVTMLGMFMLALTGLLCVMATLSRLYRTARESRVRRTPQTRPGPSSLLKPSLLGFRQCAVRNTGRTGFSTSQCQASAFPSRVGFS